jgi:hypothetical protein
MHISIVIVLKPKASTELRQSPACRDPKRETFRLPEYAGVSNRIRITVDLDILNQQNCGPISDVDPKISQKDSKCSKGSSIHPHPVDSVTWVGLISFIWFCFVFRLSGSECWDPPFLGGHLWSKVHWWVLMAVQVSASIRRSLLFTG